MALDTIEVWTYNIDKIMKREEKVHMALLGDGLAVQYAHAF